MAYSLSNRCLLSVAVLAALSNNSAIGQAPGQGPSTVVVSGKAAPVLDADRADVGGFYLPLVNTPQSITVLGADLLSATLTKTLSQAIRLDASLADSYNTTGYVESLAVRGFLLDQNSNFRRDGLATLNGAPVALETKERVEVLKGVTGMQSGVSAPGGLVNYVTKVPVQSDFSNVEVMFDTYGGSKLHLDSNVSWSGAALRLNVVTENLDSHFNNASGRRQLLALAFADQLSPQTAISAAAEYHYKSQPSVPGLGLLDTNGDGIGDRLPATISTRLNLNDQRWSLPFQAESVVAQLALHHKFDASWQAHLAASVQRLRVNDRLAFPDGCSSATTYVYPGLCSNGDVDIYDYRSDGEVRRLSAWYARLDGKAKILGLNHQLSGGLSGHTLNADLPPMQAYNYVGISNIYQPVPLPSDAALTVPNSDSRETEMAAHVSVVSEWSAQIRSFAGLRVTDLIRHSERSDGLDVVDLSKRVATPWVGLAWSPQADTSLYGSWGQGIELDAVPNRPAQFKNYGATLPALKSRQTEVGWKWQATNRFVVTTALFSISKPFADDLPQADGTLLRVAGGKRARHRGLEWSATGRIGDQLSLQASAVLLDAIYVDAIDPALRGRQVTNVPRRKLSTFAEYKIAAVHGLALNALVSAEQGKAVTADGSLGLPGAWQVDLGLRHQQMWAGRNVQWNLNVENLTDRAYWREAPTQSWGGVYLFPAAPRTARVSLTVGL